VNVIKSGGDGVVIEMLIIRIMAEFRETIKIQNSKFPIILA
jgi:hypothetical protein